MSEEGWNPPMTGPQLRAWRESRHLTQTQLADALGTTRWSIARYEIAEQVPRVVELAISTLRKPLKKPQERSF